MIPPLSDEEQNLLDAEIAKRAAPPPGVPDAADFPLHDIVKELGLDKPVDGTDPEFYEELKAKDANTVYKNMKDVSTLCWAESKYTRFDAHFFFEFLDEMQCPNNSA